MSPASPMNRAAALFGAVLIAGATVIGCGEQDDSDPAAQLEGVELWDEGPPPEEEATSPSAEGEGSTGKADDGEIHTTVLAATATPRFQLPFPCNQVWAGQSRTNHSPQNAVDFNRSGDEGDTVVAAAAGTVTRVENLGSRSYGRWIELSHGGGWTTRYAHLSAQSVTRGQTVRAGQKIGNVGNTGGSTGAHLHYEQRANGVAVRAAFNGAGALYFGTRNYTSKNACTSGGGGGGGGGVTGRVNTAGPALTVRSGPGTQFGAVGSVADGASVTIRCQKRGQSVTGTYGTSTLWDFIGNGYVADAYVSTGSDGQVAPTCP